MPRRGRGGSGGGGGGAGGGPAPAPGGGGAPGVEIARLVATVTADTAPLQQQLSEADRQLNSFAQQQTTQSTQASQARTRAANEELQATERLIQRQRAGGAAFPGSQYLSTTRAVLETGRGLSVALGGLRAQQVPTGEVRELQRQIEAERLGRPAGEALAAGAIATSAQRLGTAYRTATSEGINRALSAAAAAPAGARTTTFRESMIAAGMGAALGPAAGGPVPAGAAAGGGGGGILGQLTGALGLGSTAGVLRFGAGIAGWTGLLSIAGKLHDLVAGIVENQLKWEQSVRDTRVLYGDTALRVQQTAQAMATLPDVLGTPGELLQAQTQAAFLTTRYQLPAAERNQLILAAGRVAFAQGLTDARQREQLQQSFVQFAEAGGAGLRPIGVEGDPEAIARAVGLRTGAALGGLTPQQLVEARALIATQAGTRAALAAQGPEGLLGARIGLEKTLETASANLTQGLEQLRAGPGTAGPQPDVGALLHQLNQPPGAQTLDVLAQLVPAINRPPFGPGTADIGSLNSAYDDAKAALDANTEALGTNQQDLDKATTALAKLGVEATTATTHLLDFEGSLEDVTSIARGDLAAQAQAAVAARAVVNPPGFRTPEELAASARQSAEQRAYDLFVSRQAQSQPSAIREFLSRQASLAGPGLEGVREPAQAALAEIERAQPLIAQVQSAQEEGRRAALISEAARSRITKLDLDYQRAQLSVAGQLSQLRLQSLDVEEQLAPLLDRQADLQYRTSVASRSNLDIERATLSVRRESLAATERLEDTQNRGTLASARLGAIGARTVRGRATTEDIRNIPVLSNELIQARLDELEALPDALEATQRMTDVRRVGERDEITRAHQLLDLEQGRRDLEDDIEPLQRRTREIDATVASIERYLARIREAQEPERTAADQVANVAGSMANTAADAERFATASLVASGSWVNIASALAAIQAAGGLPAPPAPAPPTGDAAARIASGLGAGGLGPSRPPTPPTVPVPAQAPLPGSAAIGSLALNSGLMVDMRGLVVNNAADIERIASAVANAAGEKASTDAYNAMKRQLTYVFDSSEASVNKSMAGMIG